MTHSITVAKALLTATANNVTTAYNQAIQPFTYTPSGFVNGDTKTVLSGTPSETTTVMKGSLAGTYPITITQGTLAAVNYSSKFVNGTLTITPTGIATSALQFIPVTPRRIADTRNPAGPFGSPELGAGTSREF